MTPKQCKIARAGIGWSIKELAQACSMSPNTVYRFENGKDAYTSTANKLREALESTGQVRLEGECCVCVTANGAQP